MTDLIAEHGGYKNLKSFQTAEIVFDLTAEFCRRYIPAHKQRDQMEGAARGGKQNISEASQTAGTSRQSELRLTDVARVSLEELLQDYLDFLRTSRLPLWRKDDPRALQIRRLAYMSNRSYTTYMSYMSDPESAANCLICLINQANYLLDRQLKALEKELREKGDFRERYKEVRKRQILGQREDFDGFLKTHGLKRLENGQVVPLDQ